MRELSREGKARSMAKVNRGRVGGSVAVAGLVLVLAGYGGEGAGGGRVQSAASVVWEARIDRVSLLTIGDDPGETLHQVVGAVLVGDTLIIAQTSAASLRFYDRHTGAFLKRVGRRGEGPGEYWFLTSLQRMGERLYTYDPEYRRITVHDLSGALERTVDISSWSGYRSPELVGIFADGSFLISAEAGGRANPLPRSATFHREEHVLGRFGANGEFLDSLGYYLGTQLYLWIDPDGGRHNGGPPPFARRSSAGVIGGGYYVLDNKVAMIPVFDTAGILLREIGPARQPEPTQISRRDRDRFSDYRERLRDSEDEVIDSDEFPQFYPFYSGSTVADGTIWVLDYLDTVHDQRMDWSVYSHEGELLGRVTTEERLSIRAVDGDVAVVVHHGGWGVETVQLRRIVRVQ